MNQNMGHITSGNYTVDSMGSIHISGNVIPMIWYRTITRTNGKPHLLAITILSDIVYWYRPSEVRDERSGQVIGWQKRFKGDFLQKTYQQYADLFGESKRSIKAAFDVLEDLGVIRRLFDDVTCENGVVLYNLMYVDLNTDILYALTYPERILEETVSEDSEEMIDDMEECTPYPQNDVGGGTKFCTTPLQNNVVPPTKNCNYTKNTTESTTSNIYPIHQGNISANLEQGVDMIDGDGIDAMDTVDAYRQIIKENISYDCLKIDLGNQTGLLEEIVELMVEVISLEKSSVRIGGSNIPFQMVKSRLLKLDIMHISYVIDCMKKGTSKIKNIRAYLLTALYNAPGTIEHYYQAEVNHDMFETQGWNDDG